MRVGRKHTQNHVRSFLGFLHCNMVDTTIHCILARLLLLIVALGLALLLLRALVGEVPEVTTTETWANVACS